MNLCQRARTIALLLSCLVLTIWVTSVISADPKGNLRSTMQSIFQALTTVFPLSLSEETFEEDANRQQIQNSLRTLARHATQLASHGKSIPPSFDFLQRSLSQGAQETLELYEAGYHEEARFVFHQLIDNCFLCHSQLPSSQPFGLGQYFLKELEMGHLPPLSPYEQVRIAVATRQFDSALTACETLFRSRSTPAIQIDLMSFFEDYLRIVMRVHRNFARAINTSEVFLKRPDVPRYLNDHLITWVDTLKALQHDTSDGNELTRAQTLIEQGQKRNRFLADRRGLIYFAMASSDLHRYVSTGSKPASQLAEAYYLLGVSDSYMPRSSWISETEFFLERAIRLAPKSKVAKTAYSFLEEYVMTGFSGADQADTPSTAYSQLSELRRLIDGS